MKILKILNNTGKILLQELEVAYQFSHPIFLCIWHNTFLNPLREEDFPNTKKRARRLRTGLCMQLSGRGGCGLLFTSQRRRRWKRVSCSSHWPALKREKTQLSPWADQMVRDRLGRKLPGFRFLICTKGVMFTPPHKMTARTRWLAQNKSWQMGLSSLPFPFKIFKYFDQGAN